MSLSTGLFDRQTSRPQARPLLQFKAGKMSLGEDHSVQPDARKGCAYIYQTTGDQIVHFCWFDRRTGLIEDNFILTPREAEFKRVAECKTGRVYVLKLNENRQRFFVWMQEPNVNNDSQICENVNRFINSPPAALFNGAASGGPRMADLFGGVRGLSNLSQSDLLALLSMGVGLGSGISSDAEGSAHATPLPTPGRHLNSSRVEAPSLHTAFASSVPAATPPAPANQTSTDQAARLRLQDLHSILSTIESPTQRPVIDLSLGLDVESVRDIVQEDNAIANRLVAHLPAPDPEDRQPSASENVLNNLRSPQLHGALKSFSNAFRSGTMGPVLSQFNLGEEAVKAAQTGNLENLAAALQGIDSASDKKPKDGEQKDGEDKDGEGHEQMDTT